MVELITTIALVLCDHGLGHVRRGLIRGWEFMNDGYSVTVFAPKVAHEKLTSIIPCLEAVHVVDFSTKTERLSLCSEVKSSLAWTSRLSNIDSFDRVYCDNLPEILMVRPDATLMAQFFWHEVLIGVSSEYVELCRSLLSVHNPEILGCQLFAMNHVRANPGFKPVQMAKNPHLVSARLAQRDRVRTDLLITGGSTDAADAEFRKIVASVINVGQIDDWSVHVDPRLLPEDPPTWMQPARFDVEMYLSLRAAICRPGLGVVTDLITSGVLPKPLYEAGNLEMIHNAGVLNAIRSQSAHLNKENDSDTQILETIFNEYNRLS